MWIFPDSDMQSFSVSVGRPVVEAEAPSGRSGGV